MIRLWALVQKEWRLLARDWHALALLFLMPTAFILVMSLALQNAFARQQGVNINYYLINQDSSKISHVIADKIKAMIQFKALPNHASKAQLMQQVKNGHAQFLVVIPQGFGETMQADTPAAVEIFAGPDVMPAISALFNAGVQNIIGHAYLNKSLAPLTTRLPKLKAQLHAASIDALVTHHSLYQNGPQPQRPSAVQQNVPAWLLFALFFIAIPLSTTWINERQQGTYTRLQTLGMPSRLLILGKLLPYWLINMIQIILMLAVGVWIVPLFGGGQLNLGHSPWALVLIALAASFAAVSFGLLVGRIAASSEQATIITGIGNLLMAAVGGIMVPRFVMPHMMQAFSAFSPMAWGLDGFLDIFLRGNGVAGVAPEAGKLVLFGVICLLLAMGREHRAARH